MSKGFIYIDHDSSNPFFNLAAESYFLHSFEENVVFLYVNEPTVVVGKHQNAFDECRVDYCNANGIHIARRLSGGGTVFHGPGNLNFCFIKNGEDTSKLIDFKKHLEPVIAYLQSLGLPAVYSGRNDILVDGFKVSGNAEHIFSKRKRVIHHGTLLFDADLDSLHDSISPKEHITFDTHAVKSVRSKVKNLADLLPKEIDFKTFHMNLAKYLGDFFGSNAYQLNQEDKTAIDALITSKFGTWDWNFGYSPKFKASITLANSDKLHVVIHKGFIQECHLDLKPLGELNGLPFSKATFISAGYEVNI